MTRDDVRTLCASQHRGIAASQHRGIFL